MKLSGCARKIEVWSKEKIGSLGKLISSKREELEALIRSRSDWLAAGDRNSRKFTDEKGISETVCNFLDDLFTSSSPFVEDFGLCSDGITGGVGLDMRHELERCLLLRKCGWQFSV
ncbi:hypothetical protein Dsin_010796 [Dipteronia sinensis]|uniref:Uncharacterized protein n=1 Tax=Dipteronia sinensis TaxID=43782 RepID=A0AAE0AT70_9ROSI|nr:hypothetical protein Dsin_010796 [Dipteronia sinensis]